MPEFKFKSISEVFGQKASDRAGTRVTDTGATDIFARARVAANNIASGATTVSDTALDGLRMRGPYGGSLGGDERVGFVLTSDQWIAEGRAIQLHAGPSQIQWTAALRAADEPTKSGHARFAQARVAHGNTTSTTYFDSPKIGIEFQTGNIMPIPLLLDEVQIPHGLDDFYLFMELINQPPLIAGDTAATRDKEGKHNYVWIFYTSLQFPQVVLKGYFDPAGVTWQDEAGALAQFTWNADFVIHEMSPELWQRNELVAAYSLFMKNNVRLF